MAGVIGGRWALVGASVLSAVVLSAFGAQTARAANDFYVTGARDVCHLPRPGNNGKVVAQDGGSSVRLGGTTYFVFGDTNLDTNGDGGLTPIIPGEDNGDWVPIAATIAKTTDSDASDCIDNLIYKEGENGFAVPVLPSVPGEMTLWGAGAVAANNNVYFYYNSVNDASKGAIFGNPAQAMDTGLARLWGDPEDMNAQRYCVLSRAPSCSPAGRGTLWQGALQFSQPLPITDGGTDWIYVFAPTHIAPPGNTAVHVARVRPQSMMALANYQYWNGSGWVSSLSEAQPIFNDPAGIPNMPTISYNTELGRYLAVYTCGSSYQVGGEWIGEWSKICARTAVIPGESAAAITGGWNPSKEIYDCPDDFALGPNLDCYSAFQHPEYGDGDTIYITTGRLTPGRYGLMLREFTISKTPLLDQPSFINAASDYSDTQLDNDWIYQTRQGSNYGFLGWDSFWKAWTGTEQIVAPWDDGVPPPLLIPAPLLNQDSGYPSATTDPVRTWLAPTEGDLRIRGEVWNQFSCGDGVRAEIARQGGGQLWSATLPAGGSTLYDVSTTVQAGDPISFVIAKNGSATCDNSYFSPTMEFRADSDGDGSSNAAELTIGTQAFDDCPDNSQDDAWPPDLDKDTAVTLNDILILADHYQSTDARYDIFGEGSVNIPTILKLARQWGSSCQP